MVPQSKRQAATLSSCCPHKRARRARRIGNRLPMSRHASRGGMLRGRRHRQPLRAIRSGRVNSFVSCQVCAVILAMCRRVRVPCCAGQQCAQHVQLPAPCSRAMTPCGHAQTAELFRALRFTKDCRRGRQPIGIASLAPARGDKLPRQVAHGRRRGCHKLWRRGSTQARAGV